MFHQLEVSSTWRFISLMFHQYNISKLCNFNNFFILWIFHFKNFAVFVSLSWSFVYLLFSLTFCWWQVDKMAIWQNGKFTTWQVDKMASWQNGKFTKWQVHKMASSQNPHPPIHTPTHIYLYLFLRRKSRILYKQSPSQILPRSVK
jgi:hypothetical protein